MTTKCEEAIALVKLLWNLYGAEKVLERYGQETYERFLKVIEND